MSPPSLACLLWRAMDGLDQAHRDHGAGTGAMPSLQYWANLLRVLDEDGAERRDLAKMLRVSKRTVRSNISAAQRKGWVCEVPTGRGMARVALTESGAASARQWERLRRAAELTWERHAGEGAAERIAGPLGALVSRLPLEHPHYPARYGTADASVTGGYGQDWRPVPREDGDTVSGLPLSALVSQALMGFALAYEDQAGIALSLSTLILRRIPPAGLPLQRLGGGPGDVSALVRHGYLRSEARQTGPVLSLTAKGQKTTGAFEGHVAAVEEAWSSYLGASVVGTVRHLLARIGPQAQV